MVVDGVERNDRALSNALRCEFFGRPRADRGLVFAVMIRAGRSRPEATATEIGVIHMARIHSLRQAEQQMAELERRVSHLSQQLSLMTSSCREIYDAMEDIERQCQRLPSVASLQELAMAAQETARTLHDVR